MGSPTSQQAKGAWKKFKGRLQEAWGVLTNDDLDRYEGKRDRLVGHIQEKTGEKRKAIRDRIDRISTEAKYKF
jgi:uncharacterized protein YjbJ (UPF0337 family)